MVNFKLFKSGLEEDKTIKNVEVAGIFNSWKPRPRLWKLTKQLKFKSHQCMHLEFISNNVDVMTHDYLSSVALALVASNTCVLYNLSLPTLTNSYACWPHFFYYTAMLRFKNWLFNSESKLLTCNSQYCTIGGTSRATFEISAR